MAESIDKISPSKPRLRFLLCCFRSSPKVHTQKPSPIAPRNRGSLSLRFRFKKSSATVPVDAVVPEITVPCHDEHSLSPVFKKSSPLPLIKPRAPPLGVEIVRDSGYEPIKPSQTRKIPKPTQSNFTAGKLSPAKKTAALSHSLSLSSRLLNRQKDLKKSVSHLPSKAVSSTTQKPLPKTVNNSPAKKFDLVIVIVSVAIVVLWGRLWAILCTAGLFYLGRRMRSEVEQDGGGGGGCSGIC